jgi:glycosyltransferase involved in cell wall biosynthesis
VTQAEEGSLVAEGAPAAGRERAGGRRHPELAPGRPRLRVVPTAGLSLPELAARAEEVGLRRIDVVAWRDLEDPEAGGSEVHAHEVLSRWAAVGLKVRLTTSAAAGMPATTRRSGYDVTRRFGRYAVFPRGALELWRRRDDRDGLVEIWNGMPFLSPIWAGCPRLVLIHHVHAEMWRMVLPRPLAVVGDVVERHVAPWLYRTSRVVTLSASSRREIVDMLGFDPELVQVVPPGVGPRFESGGVRAADPLVVAVGRLVPVKRFDELVRALLQLRERHPRMQAVIVGDGYERPALEQMVADAGAGSWLSLPGRLDEDALVALYQRAWVLVSTSRREGWGMTITEAAACGTPAVATRIAGHVDAIDDGRTGLLVDDTAGLVAAVDRILTDDRLRRRLGEQAERSARRLTWEATAAGCLAALVTQAEARRRR